MKIVLKHAEENRASRVVGIKLQVGELRGLEEEWIQRYFDYLSKDTPAAGARISLIKIPLELKCAACGNTFNTDLRQDQVRCPVCGGAENTLTSGYEFLIDSIEVI